MQRQFNISTYSCSQLFKFADGSILRPVLYLHLPDSAKLEWWPTDWMVTRQVTWSPDLRVAPDRPDCRSGSLILPLPPPEVSGPEPRWNTGKKRQKIPDGPTIRAAGQLQELREKEWGGGTWEEAPGGEEQTAAESDGEKCSPWGASISVEQTWGGL